jgi:hypothetical protein
MTEIDPKEFGKMQGDLESVARVIKKWPADLQRIHDRIDGHMEKEELEQKAMAKDMSMLSLKMAKVYWAVGVFGTIIASIPLLKEVLPWLLQSFLSDEQISTLVSALNIITFL